MNQSNFRWTTPLLTSAALALGPYAAHASGFALMEQSASRLGTAFAGTAAATDDSTTSFFNPAGLTYLQGPEIAVVASGVQIASRFNDEGSQPAFGQPLGGEGGDAGGWNFVPAAYFATPIGDNLAAGLALNAPFGLKLEYDSDWLGRFQARKSEIKTMNVNPSIAWQVNDRVSLGAGVSFQQINAELTNAVNYSAVVAQGVQRLVAQGRLPAAAVPTILAANAGLEGNGRVKGDDTAWGYNLGAIFDVTDSTRLGLAYRSRMKYEVSGTVRFDAPTATDQVGAAIIAGASAEGGPLASGPVSVKLELPDSVLFSLRQTFGDRTRLLADIGWTAWSTVQELRVVRDTGETVTVTPEKWKDVWRYAIGGEYDLSSDVTLRGGLAYDGTPVPDETRTPRLPDPYRKWVALGVRWQPSEAMAFDLGYAHLFSGDAPLDQNAGNTAAYGLVLGHQGSDINIVRGQFVYRF